LIVMRGRYIEFISEYCDRRCERCAFTERCSTFAVTSALAMCDGDFAAAIDLAVGRPRVPGAEPEKAPDEQAADERVECEPTGKDLDEIGRELEARRARVEKMGDAEASLDYAVAASRWLDARDRAVDSGNPDVPEAIATIGWDSHLIHVKTLRALEGRDEHPEGEPFATTPVQSDWNGSAKIARICIDRSERAWRVVAAAVNDEAAGVLADSLAGLRREVEKAFPRAMEFRRPGFDDDPGVA
jgi:hypothetical protein